MNTKSPRFKPLVDRIDASPEREARLNAELATLRDQIAADGTTLCEKNDGAALQVAAQYGEDPTEYQSLGRTRKSERGTGLKRASKKDGNVSNG